MNASLILLSPGEGGAPAPDEGDALHEHIAAREASPSSAFGTFSRGEKETR
jgi:hypothetical protein